MEGDDAGDDRAGGANDQRMRADDASRSRVAAIRALAAAASWAEAREHLEESVAAAVIGRGEGALVAQELGALDLDSSGVCAQPEPPGRARLRRAHPT